MNRLPCIALVTPSFNQGQYLEETIESVLGQNYPNLEYIIMDGGSTDNSVGIIKKHEKHLTYWQSKPDGGQYAAIHDGFARTTGSIMAWLNSDDKLQPNALFKVAYLLNEHPEVDWLTGIIATWDEAGRISFINEGSLPAYCRAQYLRKEYDRPYIQQESTFWRRTLWEKAGAYIRADLNYAGDLELWARFYRYARLYTVNTLLGGIRRHAAQKISRHMNCYDQEAVQILTAEQKLFRGESDFNPPAPPPITFDLLAFMRFVKSMGESAFAKAVASEFTIDYLLNRPKALSDRIEQLNLRVRQLHDSWSWRITRPLRYIFDFFIEK